MGDIIGISLFAITGVLLALNFKAERPQFSALMGIALGILILGICLGRMGQVLESLYSIRAWLGTGGSWLGILLKVLGITYICEFAAGTCRDAGYGLVAGQIEVLGKLTVMISGMSILMAVIEQLQTLI